MKSEGIIACLAHGGTHFILPVIMGFNLYPIRHYGAPIETKYALVFIRHPRNRLISQYRWWVKKGKRSRIMPSGTDDTRLAWLLRYEERGGTFMETQKRHARWITETEFPVVRFEDAIRGPEGVRLIADAVGASDRVNPVKVYDEVYATGPTYTGKFSNWKEWFGPETRRAWREVGGLEIEEMMGYSE